MAVAALIGALVLFWISTRQFALLVRLPIWGAGVSLLIWCALGAGSQQDQLGLWQAIAEIWTRDQSWREAAIIRALLLNVPTIAPFLQQLLDFFLLAGAVAGVLALLAFTPGDRLEKILRPAILAVLGFVAGSACALAVVAIGFGGYVKPRSFAGTVEPSAVHDGDTFWLGESSLRLYGVDAPELTQVCLAPDRQPCGEMAQSYLANRLGEGTVQCDQMLSRRSNRPRDTFGRALVRCWVSTDDGSRFDVGRELIRSGYAVQYEGEDYGYEAEETEAARLAAGLLATCTLRPDFWRNRNHRESFLSSGRIPADALEMGACRS